MNTFWTILLESNLILSIVYLGYILFLRNLTFFRWTRIYLLGGMLTGLIYPVLKTKQVVHTPAESVTIVIPNMSQITATQSTDYSLWAIYGVSLVSLLFFIQFLVRFFSLIKIHRDSENAEFNGEAFRNTNRQINPFSFWKWIYIHRDSHSDFEMKQIVTHEHIHTRQLHTFDVLVSEICSIICWYNPVIRHLSKAVKDNLEFLVDAEVLHSGIDKVSYQHSLVGISLSGFPQPLHGNEFAFKTLKRRIKMMNEKRSSRSRLTSFLFLAPVVLGAASLLTFSCQKETLDTLKSAEKGEGISLTGKGKVEIGELKIGDGIMKEDSLKNTLKSKVTSGVIVKNGKTLTTFSPDDNFNDEDGFTVITTNDQTREGDIVGLKTDYKNFEIKDSPDFVQIKPISNIIIRGTPFDSNTPLYFLDGKEVDGLENLNPKEIESISVLKDKSATALYGDKAKNGVILIVTKTGIRR